MVNLTFAQGKMKLRVGRFKWCTEKYGTRNGRFECYTERYETRGCLNVSQKGMKLGDGRFDCCSERYETRGWYEVWSKITEPYLITS